ncbi:unnamed protein product [Clavelina lepadiformis]|uniref:Uncharacterized protein n=1 Tax=Clavelina lepadiformis TaxID=159417 RepID=A0ABP0G610_CLALP
MIPAISWQIVAVTDEMRYFCSKGFEVVTPNNESINIKGSLAAILADTPAGHQVMGMKEEVGFAFRKCSHCLATVEEIKTKTWEEDFTLRDTATHEEHCKELTEKL